jgi:hypothetical protein
MLTLQERMILIVYCGDHPLAVCPRCSESLSFIEIGADSLMGHYDFCKKCSLDLAGVLRTHLAECTWMRIQGREVRERVRESVARETSSSSRNCPSC